MKPQAKYGNDYIVILRVIFTRGNLLSQSKSLEAKLTCAVKCLLHLGLVGVQTGGLIKRPSVTKRVVMALRPFDPTNLRVL